jgi:hypothetical protein
MGAEFCVTVADSLNMSDRAIVGLVVFVLELAFGFAGLELRHDQELLGLILKPLCQLLHRSVINDVGKTVVYADRLATLAGAFRAQIAQIGGQRKPIPVPIVLVYPPRAIAVQLDTPLANGISMFLLTRNYARSAVRAVFIID